MRVARNPHGLPLVVVTLARRPCANCGRHARLTLLPKYYDRTGRQWCLPCVRAR